MKQEARMTTVGGRPTPVTHINSSDGVYIACRLSSGEDAYVPLTDIFAVLNQEIRKNQTKIKTQ